MKIVATIEARMESSRFAGKTLAPILGRPMLEMLIERVRRARCVEQIVVATTDHPADRQIGDLARRLGVGCFRGSSDDVLDRVLRAAQAHQAELIVELTGDCPLLDAEVIDQVISLFLSGSYDYASNTLVRSYPRGLDTQVFPVRVLAEVAELTHDPADREHVSLYIYGHPERYRLGNLEAPPELRHPDFRLTVDTAQDLALISEIYQSLYPTKPDFSLADVVRLLQGRPQLLEINRKVGQKAVQASTSRTLRAGIVGCGRIGCAFDDDPRRGYVSTHAGAYTRTAGVELVALADVDGEKLARYGTKFNVPGRYSDYRQMLSCERLDIVSVCTRSDTHREIVESAVTAGVKAVFCEKPIAQSLVDADEMVRRCAQEGVLLAVDHQRRFDRFHQEAAAFVRRGELGEVQQATAYYTAGIANTGTHLLDLLRFFLGDAEWVEALPSRCSALDSQDPNLDGWIQFRGGARVALQACDVNSYTIFEVNFLGTRGRLRVLDHGFEAQFEQVEESRRYAGYRELFPAPVPFDAGGSREYMLQAVTHILGCLSAGTPPVSSGQDGRAALELICALRQSADAGGERVYLPLAGSPIIIASR